MLLEIEGIAHTGKTTLTKALAASDFITDTMKLNRTGDDEVAAMYKSLYPLAMDSWVHVSDRGHGSEWVYSNLYHRRCAYTSPEFWEFDMKMAKAGTLIIYMTQPQEVLLQRYAETGRKQEGDLDDLEELWNSFLLDTYCKVLRVDHRFTTDEIVKSIRRYVIEGEI